jgi:DNA polymerase III psi subunit
MTTDADHPQQQDPGYVMLPVATRDFILQALRSTTEELSKTHRLRATRAILVEEGVKLTKANSFQIDHRDHLLLMQLAQRMLLRDQG